MSRGKRRAAVPEPALPRSAPPRGLQHHELILAIVASDNTFVPIYTEGPKRGSASWEGRCIHCRAKLYVGARGDVDRSVTIEHIFPQHLGGTDTPENLALACARCNQLKGRRLDPLGARDERLIAVVKALHQQRRERWREPPQAAVLNERMLIWLSSMPLQATGEYYPHL